MGLAVAVADESGVIARGHWGIVAEGSPVHVRATTRAYVAVVMVQCWERGLIDLFAPLSVRLDDDGTAPSGRSWSILTVGDLLTSAVPDAVGDLMEVVRRITGATFSDYLTRTVLAPLGTSGTQMSPATGLLTTTVDHAGLLAMLLRGGTTPEDRILQAKSVCELVTPRQGTGQVRRAFGFDVHDPGSPNEWYGYTGMGSMGAQIAARAYPGQGYAVVATQWRGVRPMTDRFAGWVHESIGRAQTVRKEGARA
jgi:CubicO group peptidase (beta-lactamase class C family)